MPGVRKPTETLQLSGAFKKDPKRTRGLGPKSDRELGEPPAYCTVDVQLIWAEVQSIVPAGLLTSADRLVVELLCRIVAKLREGWITAAEMGQMTWCLSHLGMTPVDRSKVAVPQQKEASPFDEFMQ